MKLKKIAGIVLIVLGAAMVFLGLRAGILPPSMTGIGFLAIAAVFLTDQAA
ncbi:MAG: hypothetical protein AB8B95_04235 [Pseudohongiellaceae bacterium]